MRSISRSQLDSGSAVWNTDIPRHAFSRSLKIAPFWRPLHERLHEVNQLLASIVSIHSRIAEIPRFSRLRHQGGNFLMRFSP